MLNKHVLVGNSGDVLQVTCNPPLNLQYSDYHYYYNTIDALGVEFLITCTDQLLSHQAMARLDYNIIISVQ